jgi:hypothetical protein
MRKFVSWKRTLGIALTSAGSWFFLFSAWGLGSQSGQLQVKIEELEERLQRLEDREAAQPPAVEGDTEELRELRRQLDILAAEVERLRSGEEEIQVTEDKAQALGLGPSAVSIYRKKSGVSIAGYGEMLYENFDDQDEGGEAVSRGTQLDFVRNIVYAGYRFSDKFVFNSEIEFEHGSTSLEGSASVEFAYLDYVANDHLTLRGGLLLVPMGLVNEFHEPNVFLGARRPETERRIIPSTWRENGFGAVGSVGILNYRAYVVNGLDGARFGSNGVRGGRQKGSEAKASNMAFVGRLDVAPVPGVFFGASIYRGGSGQGQFEVSGRNLDVRTTIGEVHGQVQLRGFDIRGLYARASLDDVADLNEARGLVGTQSIGETMEGGYIQFGYNILSPFFERPGATPYYRFEQLDTQAEVPVGFSKNPARDRTFHTFGFEFRPIYNIVVKSDYQWLRNKAKAGINQFNIAMGYSF